MKILSLKQDDIDEIVFSFKAISWHKPKTLYENYLTEQVNNLRTVLIARQDEKFCGYVTIKWQSSYPGFYKQNIPEISDLNVLPCYRKQGIGSALIVACEEIVQDRGHAEIGIGVGMTADYGNAQRLYVQLGYIPDGCGLFYKCDTVHYGSNVIVDDDLLLWLVKKM
ncbi:MAG: GNAT family N-acetyltransferase [Gammaproteobacteria bacterium]|nr:GNAT family N-acetyltransferase [Gammaproteobacteria bacterium]